jgi:hypothetical protein
MGVAVLAINNHQTRATLENDLWRGKGDFSHSRLDCLGFVTIGVSLALGRVLVRCGFQVLLPLRLHGCVHNHSDQIGQNFKSLTGNLFQHFGR